MICKSRGSDASRDFDGGFGFKTVEFLFLGVPVFVGEGLVFLCRCRKYYASLQSNVEVYGIVSTEDYEF